MKVINIQEAQQTPNKMNSKRPTPRHTTIRVSKDEWILKAARAKQTTTFKGSSIRLSLDFLSESLEVRREWADLSKC